MVNLSLAAAAAAIILCSPGCAPKATGPLRLNPAGALYTQASGYSSDGKEAEYKDSSVTIKAAHVKGTDRLGGSALVKKLVDEDYVFLMVGIENTSSKRVVFSPASAAFKGKVVDYKRPLDYTDLYDVARSMDGTDPDAELSNIRRNFFDLNVTLLPGATISRLLIFTPLSGSDSSAELVLRDIYVGGETISVSFPFDVDYSGGP